MKRLLLAGIAGMLLMSCNKDEQVAVDYDITFTIIEPEDGAVFFSGDEFHMEADLEGTKPIGNAEMLAINLTTGDTLFSYRTATTQDFLMLHDHIDLFVADHSDCVFVVSAWEEQYAERLSAQVHFHIMP